MTEEERETAWLRAEFARNGDDPASESLEACPSPERIWEAVEGSLGPEETRALVDHMAACAACAEEWRLAVELGGVEKGRVELEGIENNAAGKRPASVPVRARPVPWRTWLPLAAALSAVAAGVSLYELRDRSSGTEQPRSRGAEKVQEVLQPLVTEGSVLDRDRFVLRWTEAPGNPSGKPSYTVLVHDAALQPLCRKEGLPSPQIEIPASAFAGVQTSEPVFWLVTATYPDGTTTSSGTLKVLLR